MYTIRNSYIAEFFCWRSLIFTQRYNLQSWEIKMERKNHYGISWYFPQRFFSVLMSFFLFQIPRPCCKLRTIVFICVLILVIIELGNTERGESDNEAFFWHCEYIFFWNKLCGLVVDSWTLLLRVQIWRQEKIF